ncbi:MAG TPA: hypothetical protein VFA74_01650 [Terriglobales bacterium]|nr:hypothetical protein [Terriglobales bacterium]
MNFPGAFFVTCFVGLWLATRAGVWVGKSIRPLPEESREDYNLVLAATLTFLGLIISFVFAMAVGRYDQRKIYEEDETNAIGTEFVRAEFLPPEEKEHVRKLLREYIAERVLFYTTRDPQKLSHISDHTTQLQRELWSAVRSVATADPSPITALVVSGMNDVLNSQGYTQAAWLNRIPTAAWILMISIAVFCNVFVGYGARRTGTGLLVILPLVLAVAFFLIADIDSPRRGIIHVVPQNLLSLSRSLQAPN